MLKSSYAVLQQFQKEISEIQNFQDLKALADKRGIQIVVEFFPKGMWFARWNITTESISGVLEVGFKTSLQIGKDFTLLGRGSLRYENPRGMCLQEWEAKIFDSVYNTIKQR